jgi:methylthioribulose-1-phosphate dehydratase
MGGDPVAATSTSPEFLAAELLRAGSELAAESARFAAMGWMRGTSGNLSQVLARDPLRLAVTASGLDKGELTETDVVLVDGNGELLPGDDRGFRPSAEAGLHARIAAVTGANAAVHVHAMAAVEAGFHWPEGVELHDLEMLKGIGHSAHGETVVIPVIQNSQDMVELGDAFEAVYKRPANGIAEVPLVIVASHGMYAWGADLKQARWHAEIAEWLLRFMVRTRRP